MSDLSPRKKLEILGDLLGAPSPKLPNHHAPKKIIRPAQPLSHAEAQRIRMIQKFASARPNHEYRDTLEGHGCLTCPPGSMFRMSPDMHPYVIHEEP